MGTGAAQPGHSEIEVPASTAWPVILAFGLTLLVGGLATGPLMSAAGAVLAIAAVAGWFREVFPREHCEVVQVIPEEPVFSTARPEVSPLESAKQVRRAWLPLHVYPVSAGIKGGLAGGAVMAVLAMIYGAVSGSGIWFPINLLAAGFFPAKAPGDLVHFHTGVFAIAFAIHLLGSLLSGVLYGAILPMLPRHPILLGGVFVPMVWTGLFYSSVGIVNPVLSHSIDWFWFALSQFCFGIVAGVVVTRQERIATWQKLPLAVRAGIEGSGLRKDEEER